MRTLVVSNIDEVPSLCSFLCRFRENLAGVANRPTTYTMVDVNNVSNEINDYLHTTTDSCPDTTGHTCLDQNMTADDYNTTNDEIPSDQHSALIFALLLFKWILFPFIVTGNGLTIIVVMKFVKKITPSHVGIAFLSVAGLLAGIVPFLNLIIQLMRDSVHLRYIYLWLFLFTAGLNISAMLLIAFERLLLVTSWKFHQKHLTVRRQVGLCMAFSVYFFLSAGILTLLTDPEFKYGAVVPRSKMKGIISVLVIPTYTLATCTILYCYLKICLFIWKQRKTLISSQSNPNQQHFQKEKKTTVLIAIILTLYLSGTLPTFVYALLVGNNPKILKPILFVIFRLLWYVATLIDTFVYAWKVPDFQQGYRKILCCLCNVRSRTIQVAPVLNVLPCGSSLPLEPRRE